MPFRIRLPRSVYGQMVDQARQELPNECCGQLAGTITPGDSPVATLTRCFPLVNVLASPTRYRGEDAGLFRAQKEARLAGLEILAVYHSHPTSAPVPSVTDLDENAWGTTAVFFIISLAGAEPDVRAWFLEPTTYREAEWEVVDETDARPE